MNARHNIIAVVSTKDRPELLRRALLSIQKQKYCLNEVILCSDSIDEMDVEKEMNLASTFQTIYIRNNRARNCSGVRNTAIYDYIKRHLGEIVDFKQTYIAFLDDDDFWEPNYIEECCKNIQDYSDMVVSGLIFEKQGSEPKYLGIPSKLTLISFLEKNPHIQGSNLFIRLDTLLKGGLFDENMSSSVDRDLMVRVMLLDPKISFVRKHLVHVDVNDDRCRVTNSVENKKKDFAKFWNKYHGLMSQDVEQRFFERIRNLFNISQDNIFDYIYSEQTKPLKFNSSKKEVHSSILSQKIVLGVVISNIAFCERFLGQFVERTPIDKLVVVKNFRGDSNCLLGELSKLQTPYTIIDNHTTIKEILITRNILFQTLYDETSDGDVVLVFDDDMELKYLKPDLTIEKLDIANTVCRYQGKYDAVVGDYTMDPPLPSLSTLRTKLLDYVYHKKLNFSGVNLLSEMSDYYYDLSERNGEHLETPFILTNENTEIEDIFSGKSTSRPLTFVEHEERIAKCCGGNVIIYNRNLLKIKHESISIGKHVGRRSDYFWVLKCRDKGYKVYNCPFATLHNRIKQDFNLQREMNKLMRDMIGASLTKTIENSCISISNNALSDSFWGILKKRVTLFVCSYFRIVGLLYTVGDVFYLKEFNEKSICDFVSVLIREEKLYRCEKHWEN